MLVEGFNFNFSVQCAGKFGIWTEKKWEKEKQKNEEICAVWWLNVRRFIIHILKVFWKMVATYIDDENKR